MTETDKKIRHAHAVRIATMEDEIQFLNYLLSALLSAPLSEAVNIIKVHLGSLSKRIEEERKYITEMEKLLEKL